MRMTNKIMQNNSLYNINQNKILQDKLSTQMSTQKKLTRPSDDPVVAIRALRLRTSVSELKQYHEKNAPDAESWLKVTSDGLSTANDILTNLSRNANKGANKDLKAEDLDIIITQMKSLSDEFYATGNLDYAGRYVFTGFRTDTPMQFTASDVADTVNPIPLYQITEQVGIDALDTVSYTTLSGNNVNGTSATLSGITSSNYQDSDYQADETIVNNSSVHRLRMAYRKVLNDGNPIDISVYDESANTETKLVSPVAVATKEAACAKAIDGISCYVAETGEIFLSDADYKKIADKFADPANQDVEIRIDYKKKEWENGDLRPEHFFRCQTQDTSGTVDYNKEYTGKLYANKDKQVIAYDVGYNQTIEINTTADEVFQHGLRRDIQDLDAALTELKNIEEVRATLEDALDGLDEKDPTYDATKKQYDAADKAYTYIRENMHDLMQKAITKMQSYLDDANVAVTDNGTRASRLELISNRLMDQTTTFETLQSENEDVDIAEVAIQMTSANLTYEASLTATSKIMQTTLMNYI